MRKQTTKISAEIEVPAEIKRATRRTRDKRGLLCRITYMRSLVVLAALTSVARGDVTAPGFDGGKVVFRSRDIWSMAAGGGALFVSADGKTLRVDASGTQPIANFACSRLASDGTWVYCGRPAQGLSRIPARGGASETLTPEGGFSGLAADAKFLYLFGVAGIWRMSKNGGPRMLVRGFTHDDLADAAVDDRYVYWTTDKMRGVLRAAHSGGPTVRLLPGELPLRIASDGRSLYVDGEDGRGWRISPNGDVTQQWSGWPSACGGVNFLAVDAGEIYVACPDRIMRFPLASAAQRRLH
jgi:hypothetical protein